jgi:hypothetical protein
MPNSLEKFYLAPIHPPSDRLLLSFNPAAAASASTSPTLMSLEARLPPSLNPEQLILSPIREELPLIIEKPQKYLI